MKEPPKVEIGLEQYFNKSQDILDLTASYRKMYKDKSCPIKNYGQILFLDKRACVSPNIVASNEHLPFRSKSFGMVVYDPPHIIDKKPNYDLLFFHRFGCWSSKKEFYNNIRAINEEAARVLTDNGVLLCKMVFSELSEPSYLQQNTFLLLLSNFKLIKVQKLRSRSYINGRDMSWLWLMVN